MNTTTRISRKIRPHLRLNRKDHRLNPPMETKDNHQLIPAIPKGRGANLLSMAAEIINHWLVTQQKPLEDLVPHWIVRWFLRWVYQRYGFAAMGCRCKHGVTYFNLEHRGTLTDEAEARYWASQPGGGYKRVPHGVVLPDQTAQYGTHDFPLSEASPEYRNRQLPFTVVPTYNLERLAEIRQRTDALVEEYRQSA